MEPVGTQTIAALATPPVAGGIGILRVSGPDALDVCLGLVPSLSPPRPPPEARRAYTVTLQARDGARLDTGLWLSFQAPASYTGEDVVELHAHGSPALLQELLRELLIDPRVRLAQPGEFTRRAFLNGKLDLTQAEAVAELIAADSGAAVRAAASQLSGALSERLRGLLGPLRELHADLEALLDFPEESEGAEVGLLPRLEAVWSQARALLDGAERGRLVRSGARLALFGPPNAGKSSLFNALLGEERALVDEDPGTTRDVLEARWSEGGVSLTLLDTAGLREAPGRVEQRGVAAARAALQGIDAALLVLPVVGPRAPATADGSGSAGEASPAPDAAIELERWRAEVPDGIPTLVVHSKADLLGAHAALDAPGSQRVSVRTGEGLAAVRAWVSGLFASEQVGGAVVLVGERNAQALKNIEAALRAAKEALPHGTLELVAGEVMLAHAGLSELLGEHPDRELLDALFARFCIGK